MSKLAEIALAVRDEVSEILGRFEVLMRDDPWIHLPADYHTDQLPDVLPLLADAALQPGATADTCRRLLFLAASHGEHRLAEAFSETLLFHEYYLLRKALWSFLGDDPRWEAVAVEAIFRVDHVISLVAQASTRGYHRPVYERQGRWPRIIEELIGDWTPPPAPPTGGG